MPENTWEDIVICVSGGNVTSVLLNSKRFPRHVTVTLVDYDNAEGAEPDEVALYKKYEDELAGLVGAGEYRDML